MSKAMRDWVVGAALLVCAAVVPFVTHDRYIVTQTTLFFIWATVVTQWNLVFGVGGIFSLAQMALFAFGAYGTAMLGYYAHWPMWLAIPAGSLSASVASLLIGLACLRLRGPYVALLTLAIAQVLYLMIINDTECFIFNEGGCMPLFGGMRGVGNFGDLGFHSWLGARYIIGDYFVALALLAVAFAFSAWIARGPFGLAFRALRDNPSYALSRGVSKFRHQLWIFALSSFFTGLAGAIYAGHFRVVGPTVFSFALLLYLLSMIVVGGVGSIWGPLIGAALLMLADEGWKEAQDWRAIGMGLVLPAFIILLPGGVVGLFNRLQGRGRAAPAHAGPAAAERDEPEAARAEPKAAHAEPAAAPGVEFAAKAAEAEF
jgi:branched-chain amino acid transport system permease protein